MNQPHFLVVTFPAQGHINPGLQCAFTFATSASVHRRMSNTSIIPNDLTLKHHGSRTLTDFVLDLANKASPVTCIVYTLPLPWVADLARKLFVPCCLLWIQPATVDIYYYYFNGYADLMANRTDPSYSVELPGLPFLTCKDIPSFFLPSNTYAFTLKAFKEQLEKLEQETKVQVLDPSDKSFGADLFKVSKDYIEWLNSKPNSSVVYVSFGSIAMLPKKQMEAMANGLLQGRRPFLWVIRRSENGTENEENKILDQLEELNEQGLIAIEEDEGIVESEELVKCLEMVMEGESGEEMKKNAKHWMDLAREAVKDCGSSNWNLREFVDEFVREKTVV
ncbi:hypothetical protein NE237_014894 [Protea cynaroides]|uniref:Uncharacterized protein n=1 Tax=Protea cynaroides TaxID=273540 RepID=A0A9Q0KCU1_9MAGN|nr:hypothetical protein NE237_014894 [Protea cynaroides]